MPRKSRPYEVGLHERLRDTSHAVSYINAAAEDSIEGFLLALRDFAEATKGMSKVAVDADKNRENLYRMLSEEGNPRLDSLWPVLEAMGLRLAVEPITIESKDVQAANPLLGEKDRALLAEASRDTKPLSGMTNSAFTNWMPISMTISEGQVMPLPTLINSDRFTSDGNNSNTSPLFQVTFADNNTLPSGTTYNYLQKQSEYHHEQA
jgi:probable addiction module antidote protein